MRKSHKEGIALQLFVVTSSKCSEKNKGMAIPIFIRLEGLGM
jgi:hypothetical protein